MSAKFRRKIFKKYWLNTLKQTLQKWKLDQNRNDSKSHIWNSFFWKYYFGHTALYSVIQRFYISPDAPIDITRFSSRKSQSQQNLTKKITHFTINTLDIENNILPQHSRKPFWLCKFSNRHVSVWCQKKYLHCTHSWRPIIVFLKHFEINCLYISIYLLMKIFLLET